MESNFEATLERRNTLLEDTFLADAISRFP